MNTSASLYKSKAVNAASPTLGSSLCILAISYTNYRELYIVQYTRLDIKQAMSAVEGLPILIIILYVQFFVRGLTVTVAI